MIDLLLNTLLLKRNFPIPPLSSQQRNHLQGEKRSNFKCIENTLALRISLHDHHITISALSNQNIVIANRCLQLLVHHCTAPIKTDWIRNLIFNGDSNKLMNSTGKLSRKTISARNSKQQNYLKGMDEDDITIAVGPAGTGKTWLAVAKAVELFEKGEVQRLIFVRPAVEAGEKLGFLPGDLVEKVLPYLRPVYDALYEIIGFKETQKLVQSDVIEILPLAFMRGRTLNEAFIILDEAQNTTHLQMKMFLTRMGFSSRMVINGDMTQTDLPKGVHSGLKHATKILQNVNGIGIHQFTSQEVVRHPLISKIIECYEQDDRAPDEK